MLRLSLLASILSIALMGCAATTGSIEPALPPSHALTHEELLAIRESYQRANPGVLVGRVTASDVAASVAAVGDVNVHQFHHGDVITFLDSNRNSLSLGTVDDVVGDVVVVYFEVQPGGRATSRRSGDSRDPVSTDAPAPTEQPPARQFILASASPRRQSLLREAGYRFEVEAADIDEHVGAGFSPGDAARFLAMSKADAVAARFPDEVILAADTVVAFGDLILGKAANIGEARKMLALLEGTTHLVITGVAVQRRRNTLKTTRVFSAVRMKPLSPGDIDNYLATGQWEGKAGAYGIQDPDPFVMRVSGCHSNIVGLPMKSTARLLDSFGIRPR